MITTGIEGLEAQLDRLASREARRKIVEAGSAALIGKLQERTDAAHHILSGEMREAFAPDIYHEDVDECWQDVYPQGYDSRGISNAKKAFVTNYGRGKRKTAKTGDKFITGKTKDLEEAVADAMRAEAARVLNET